MFIQYLEMWIRMALYLKIPGHLQEQRRVVSPGALLLTSTNFNPNMDN